jgi:hypothetical protein
MTQIAAGFMAPGTLAPASASGRSGHALLNLLRAGGRPHMDAPLAAGHDAAVFVGSCAGNLPGHAGNPRRTPDGVASYRLPRARWRSSAATAQQPSAKVATWAHEDGVATEMNAKMASATLTRATRAITSPTEKPRSVARW